jgi:hypothetical protein
MKAPLAEDVSIKRQASSCQLFIVAGGHLLVYGHRQRAKM